MESFRKTIKACIAGWRLFKEEAKEGMVNTYSLLKEGWTPKREGLEKIYNNVTPYGFQERMYEKIKDKASEGGLVVLEAPTAAGKTEAAVATFLSQLVEDDLWLAPRLIYALPTRALTFTTYARLTTYSIAMRKLLRVCQLSTAFEYGLTFGGRGYLYGGVMVAATLDAVAYGYAAQRVPGRMRNPRLSMPTALLSTSLLVLDEVQLYQDSHYYSPRVIGRIVGTLVRAGAPVVYMSATMPSAFLEVIAPDDYEHVLAEAFRGRGRVEVDAKPLTRGTGLLEALKEGSVIESMKECLENGRHVLVVANTVARAVECYDLLKERFKDDIILLHGRMCNGIREEREGRLFSHKSYIVVTTQVVEAGFDLDAGLLISEVAPLDSLIQRAGRVSRSGGEGRAVIVDVEHPYPYVKEVVESTKALLKDDPSVLESALTSVEATRGALDEVYKREIIEKIMAGAEPLITETLAYLKKLRLLSLPPEEDFTLREGFYVTLVVPEVLGALADYDAKRLIQEFLDKARKYENLKLSVNDWEKLSSLIEKASFTLGFSTNRMGVSEQKEFKKREKRALSLADLLSSAIHASYSEGYVVVSFRRVRELRPLEVYLVKEGVYELDRGLSLEALRALGEVVS